MYRDMPTPHSFPPDHEISSHTAHAPSGSRPTDSPAPDSPEVPNVYVHPPEEEQYDNPPWCVFDASDPHEDQLPLSMSDESLAARVLARLALEKPHPAADDAPAFHRPTHASEEAVMPRRGALYHQRPESPLGILAEDDARRGGEDEDVVEIVKLRRSAMQEEAMEAPARALKKSKTFRARAASAFSSLKTIGRGSRKPPAQNVFQPSRENSAPALRDLTQDSADAARWSTMPTPKLTKRKSLPLSQVFGASQRNHPVPDISDSYEEITPESSCDVFLSSPPLSSSIRRATSTTVSSPSNSHTSPSLDEESRPVSPSYSTKSKARRRFSLMDLQRLFSAPTQPMQSESHGETSDSLPSTVDPPTPKDEAYHVQFSLPSSPVLDALARTPEQAKTPRDADAERDFSFEMRLDSFHFDSLSFDPDTFDVRNL